MIAFCELSGPSPTTAAPSVMPWGESSSRTLTASVPPAPLSVGVTSRTFARKSSVVGYGGMDARITNQFDQDRNVSIGGLIAEHRLAHIKDRIARTVMSQHEDGLRPLHHLTDLRVSGRDRSGLIGPKFCLR